ncbi:hypothetical protein EFK50_15200 [Nocardioides marmoriginsengisoli]|uniref:GerMN domain-containing protein n=1 Tax=Nocardioides marmoriginsengisoli TaxID=661483 RepID=A0A3N0CHV9_9ACTN|nr:LpqB family beta-propeller domain-containing protein [Nocardioides marmoriginsengisoli]RNL63058.1 hypothetical protein EFK50_15200 [Nocardioides marmoriginsengisoli]
MTRTRLAALLAGLLAAAVAAGCSTLPVTGPVHTRADEDTNSLNQAPYFAPPGPTPGASTTAIVNGFLLAIQANPPSTAVARSFLSDAARTTWKPVQGTIVYDGADVEEDGSQRVDVRLSGSHLLDQRGAWLGASAGSTSRLPFVLTQEHGEWRIANPPTSLPVPTSYFRSLYVPYTLYFYDRTGSVLVPTRIYLPRGEQIASNLVRGLLDGPGAAVAGLDSGVTTNADGIAEVGLGPEAQRLTPPDLHRLIVQLSWTLRQVPGITRLRVTADGVPVPLPDGQSDVSLTERLEYDPVTAPAREVVAISEGRVQRIERQGATPVGGPLGQPGFALRSVAQSVERGELAAVAGNGSQLYVARDRGATGATRVQTPITGAENLLRPAYDRFGGLWAVDAARGGAVVHLVTAGTDRVVRVPGISGRRISAFTVTRDGARLVAGIAGSSSTSLAVAEVVRAERGRVARVVEGGRVTVPGSNLGSIVDVGQDGPTTAAVLTLSDSGTRHVLSVELDGSPGDQIGTPDPVPDHLVALVVSPDPSLPARAVAADGRLLELTGSGQWARIASDVLTATYAQ